MALFKKAKDSKAVNEFDQVIEGNSLTKDAWRRLKKNKMALIGLFVVIIYALIALFADLLPLYNYEEIILDHVHLPPSLTKTAGELMREKKLKTLYFDEWKYGNLKLSAEEDAEIEKWITDNKTNTVWNYLLKVGEEQREAGTFAFSKNSQKTLDKLDRKIATDLQVTVNQMYYNADGKKKQLNKMSASELTDVYCEMYGLKKDVVDKQIISEIRSGVENTIKQEQSDLSGEDLSIAVDNEMKSLGEKEINKRIVENICGKISTETQRKVSKSLEKQAAEDNSVFPIKEQYDVTEKVSAYVEASLKHSRRYYLGTDYAGRDMLSRIVYGGRVSIAIGLVGSITSILIGIIVGSLAGYLGGKTDFILMRIVDIMYGLPYMLLVIICMAIFGRNVLNLFIALALVSWLTIARMVRGQVLSLKNQEYVEAARSMGASTWRIIFKHMVPNSLSVIIIYSTLRIPAFIMQESFLSFLGLGVQAPMASWGSLIGDAVEGMTNYPWRLIYPSIVMTIFLFSMNFLGDGLRDAFDPQSKNQL